jgi:NAD(P)-dependent dehydrogenase (short-subunit alcohol dehydrogenase family)
MATTGPNQREGNAPVAIVTGAASGIGAATAVALAGRGYAVQCVDLDEAGAARTASRIASADGFGSAVRADVADDDDCRRAVEAARGLGRIAAVVNIAGVTPYATSIMDVTPEVWDRVLAVNLRSVYSMSRHAVQCMGDVGGVIINTASVHAYASHPGCAPYAASKGAIVALTRQMAIDLTSRGVRVVAVAPGAVDTPMSRAAEVTTGRSLEELGFSFDKRQIGRVASAEEIASVICWLASEGASFVNGTTVVADGGLLAPLPTPSRRDE